MGLLRHRQPILTRISPHNANRRFVVPGGTRGQLGPQLPGNLAFYALAGGQTVIRGEGDLSASTGSSTIYAPNAQGVYVPYTDEAVWEWRPGDNEPWLKYQPAGTNALTQSRNIDNWATHSGFDEVAADAINIDGGVAIRQTQVSSWGSRQNSVASVAAGTHTVKLWLKQAGTATCPGVQLIHTGLADPVNGSGVTLGLDDGAMPDRSIGSPAQAKESRQDGDYWLFMVEIAPTSSATLTINFFPAVSAQPASGAWAAQSGGEVVVGQIEVHTGKTIAQVRGLGPIFTTSAAASTAATVYAYDPANWGAGKDIALYGEFVNVGHVNNDSLWNHGSYFNGFWWQTDTTAWFRDNNNQGPNVTATVNQDPYKMGYVSHEGDNNRVLNINGVDGANTAYVNIISGPMTIGNQFHCQSVKLARNLRRYDIASYAEGKTIIDELMA